MPRSAGLRSNELRYQVWQPPAADRDRALVWLAGEYLRAFSRQSLDGLWLTAFTITGAGELEISGRALRPDLVPAYIQRLNEEEVLAGRSFARFEMSRPEMPGEKKLPAPFLEFTLATREEVKLVEKRQ